MGENSKSTCIRAIKQEVISDEERSKDDREAFDSDMINLQRKRACSKQRSTNDVTHHAYLNSIKEEVMSDEERSKAHAEIIEDQGTIDYRGKKASGKQRSKCHSKHKKKKIINNQPSFHKGDWYEHCNRGYNYRRAGRNYNRCNKSSSFYKRGSNVEQWTEDGEQPHPRANIHPGRDAPVPHAASENTHPGTFPEVASASQAPPVLTLNENIQIANIVSQRFVAMEMLQKNPRDVQALDLMCKAQNDLNAWAEQKFWQVTGSTKISPAGVSRATEVNVPPTTETIKNETLEPRKKDIVVEKAQLPKRMQKKNVLSKKYFKDKNTISTLFGYAVENNLDGPYYELCFESGPDHRKKYLFRVILDKIEYTPDAPSHRKKKAKAQAAFVCLQALGVIPETLSSF